MSNVLRTQQADVFAMNLGKGGKIIRLGEYWSTILDKETPTIYINKYTPESEVGSVLLHENIHGFLESNPTLTSGIVDVGLKNLDYKDSALEDESATRQLTDYILHKNGSVYLSTDEGYTQSPTTAKATIRTGAYGSVEYTAKYPTIRYRNAIVETSGIGISRTLTTEGSSTVPEQTLFLGGTTNLEVKTTTTSWLRDFLGIDQKTTIKTLSIPNGQRISTVLSENPTTVISQEGGITPNEELRNVYESAGIRPNGEVTILKKSVNTGLGEEWLGQSAHGKDFELAGKPNSIMIIERGPTEALLTPEEMTKGLGARMETSPYDGPKPTKPSPTKPPESSSTSNLNTGDLQQLVRTGAVTSTETGPSKPVTQLYASVPKFEDIIGPVQENAGISAKAVEGSTFAAGIAAVRIVPTSFLTPNIPGPRTRTATPTDTSTSSKSITGVDPLITDAFSSIGYLPKISFNYATTTINSASQKMGSITNMPFTTVNAVSQKTGGASVQGNVTGLLNTPSQKTTTQQTQKVSQKVVPISEFGGELAPLIFDNFPLGIPPHFKIKNQEAGRHGLLGSGSPRFSYVSDLMHASLGIHGPRTMVGISRPVPVKKKRGRK